MNSSQQCCRLCLETTDDVMVNVFESFQNSSIASILAKHFWFQALENDGFSEWLCQICWIQTKTFHDFYIRLEDIHKSHCRKEPIKFVGINALNEEQNNRLIEEIPGPDLNIVKYEATAELVTDVTGYDVEICKVEILECNDDANGQDISDEKGRTKPNIPTRSEKNKQDAQMRQFFTMKCELCPTDVKFEKLSQALKHYRRVHKIPGYLMCCGKKFGVRNRIMDHIRFHVNPNAYQCAHCEKAFSSIRALRTHTKRHFSQNKCSTCSKNFSSAPALQHHVDVKHTTKTENELLRCDRCSKAFKNVRAFNNHIRTVHFTEQVVCEICARLFKSKSSLQIHVENEHSTTAQPPTKCNICGASFKHDRYLRKHLKRHEQAMCKVDPVKCQICDKMVKNETALTAHLRLVHTEKRHQCTMCPKSFKTTKNLKEHVAVHTGEDLYTCRYCEKKGKSNANMYMHMKKAHFDEWARDNPERVRLKENLSVE